MFWSLAAGMGRESGSTRPLGCEGATGAAFQVTLEGGGGPLIVKILAGKKPPRLMLRGMRRLSGIVRGKPRSHFVAKPSVELVRMLRALKDVDDVHGALTAT
jgi:hypothetical protein